MLDYIKIGAIIFAIFSNFLLGIFVLKRNPKGPTNIVFFFVALFMFFWGIGLLFYEFPVVLSSLFWIKATYVSASLCTITILIFSFFFPTTIFRRFFPWAIIFCSAFFGFTVWLLFFTRFWIIDVIVDSVKGLQTLLGIGYLWWFLVLWVTICWTLFNFIIKSHRSTGFQKLQLRYFFYAFGLFCAIVSVPDVFIPFIYHTTSYFSLSSILSVIFSGIVAYSILKHRLMDIRFAIARSVSYFFLVLILGAVYATILFLVVPIITKEAISPVSLFVSALLALLIVFSSQPLSSLLKKITNRIFYREEYNAADLLHSLSLIMTSTIRLNDLTHTLLWRLLDKMHISRGAFILVDNKKMSHFIYRKYEKKPEFNEENISELIKQNKIVVFDELIEDYLKKVMRKLEISVIVPLRTRTEFEDILVLGEKISGEPYTSQDIHLLESFAPEASVAIGNALSVERLLRFDELKSEFVTVVSHQLRTPLSVARWNFELLLEGAFGIIPAKANDIVQDTYQTLMALNQGLNNLMSVLEIEEEKMIIRTEDVEINKEIIEEAISDWEREIKAKNIRIKRRLSFKRIINIDRQKIKRVFEILLDNAIRYSQINSTITISTTWQKGGDKDEFLVLIEDEGMGVAPGDDILIFQKFFRGEEAKKMSPTGFGLSLFMAQKYIEFHGGQLWVERKKDQGSIFKFSIPIKKRDF